MIRIKSVLKAIFGTGKEPSGEDFSDLIDSVWNKTETIPVDTVSVGQQTLVDGGTIIWDATAGTNAKVTLGGNRTLQINNVQAGQYLLLVVIQDATGGRTLALPANSKVAYGGAGVIVLSTAANARDIISCYYDGTNYYWVVNKTFS